MGTAGTTRAATPTTVRWTTTLDDLVDGTHLTARGLRRFVAVVGVAALAWGALSVAWGDAAFGLFLLAYGVLDLAMILARPLERALLARRVTHLVDRPCEVTVADGGLAIHQGTASAVIAWAEVTGVREDDRTLLVVAGRTARFGIPKRAFASPAAVDAFRDLLAERATSA